MGKLSNFKEFFDFLKLGKKWWMMPLLALFIILGSLIVVSQSSAVAPFIYTLF